MRNGAAFPMVLKFSAATARTSLRIDAAIPANARFDNGLADALERFAGPAIGGVYIQYARQELNL
jgi:hypothetical protein